jgi:hypothetical protein
MCKYCEKRVNNKKITDIDNDKEDWLEVILQGYSGNMIYVELDGTDNDGYKTCDFFKINYCPMCGRKLREEEKQ